MSFIYSQALVEASLGVRCLDTDASQPLSGSLTPKPCLWHDKTTEPFRLSRFGMTCELLTEGRGEELLTWWQAGFPAKTSALQEKVQASQASEAGCGGTWRGSLARFDPAASLWKTAQHSLLEDSEPCSVTWPRSGMTADGQCWELPMLGRRTSAIDSGFWVPTPCAMDAGNGRMNTSVGSLKQRPMLALMARKNLWPTPTVCGNHNRKGASATSGDGLATAVKMWPTPRCQMTQPVKIRLDVEKGHRGNLEEVVALRMWPTPQASDNRNRGNADTPAIARRIAAGKQVMLTMTVSGGQLNPNWVEWLMGWPIGHTDLKPSGTDKYRFAPQPHSECSQVNLSEVA